MTSLVWASILLGVVLGFNISTRFRFFCRIILLLGVVTILMCLRLDHGGVLENQRASGRQTVTIAHCIATIGPPVLGLSISIEGQENLKDVPRPAVVISNHQSELDLVMLGSFLPDFTVVMAKSDLKWVPLMGQYMMIAQNVFIDRKNLRSALETMKHVADTLSKRKLALFMYPEGTRSYQTTNELLPFKKGAFHLAIQGQIPIVPIVTSSYHQAYNLKNLLFEGEKFGSKIILILLVLPKIETTGLQPEDVDDLCKSTQELMLKTLQEISGPIPTFAQPLKHRAPKAKKD
ncbi:hypothetical protein BC829DRAFT_372688 [Chytridium lagenaria]|nr:hypothetical protein BC829DRAFT_372688 [Chytridium lagenaria]